MLLCVDIGNTQTAVGLFRAQQLLARWAFSTCASDTADEIALRLTGLLALESLTCDDIDAACIACVVPSLTESWRTAALRIASVAPIVVGPGVKTGLAMRYDNPAEIGADRVADAVAALDAFGAPVVVVDLGTATNIEVIDCDGAFAGGIIAPGLGTSAADLASHAARLPMVDLSFPAHAVGTNTADAMRSGLMWGEVARIDGLVRLVFSELGYEAPVIATGGFANVIAGLCTSVTRHEPDLTLAGLRIIYERNTRTCA